MVSVSKTSTSRSESRPPAAGGDDECGGGGGGGGDEGGGGGGGGGASFAAGCELLLARASRGASLVEELLLPK